MPAPSNPAINGKKCIPHLISRAKNMQLMQYNTLAELIGYDDPRPVAHPLWAVFAWCIFNKLPPLSRLVINKRTGNPGARALLRVNLSVIFDFDWKSVKMPTSAEIEFCRRKLDIESEELEWEEIIEKFVPKKYLDPDYEA